MRFSRVGVVFALFVGMVAVAPAGAEAPRVIYDGAGTYPRVIRLEHSGAANGRVIASVGSGSHGIILESTDGGSSFRQISTIADPDGAPGRGMCCGVLFELPRPLGALPAGTLLWANTTGWEVPEAGRQVKQRLWQSQDHGVTWAFLATMGQSPNWYNAWEPELSMAADGQLVAHWADESDKPRHDQKIVQARSRDGVTWTDQRDTVKNSDFFVRPGMPGVRQLPDGTYFMVYEVCNLAEPLCSIYSRTSPDGWDYGDPFDLGIGVRTADGKYPRHTPTIDITSTGTILLVSEMLVNADGSHAPNNGAAILVNDQRGAGPWREIAAPVTTPGVNNEGCRNFSPSLLVSPDDSSVLEVATDFDGDVCKAYYASGPIA